MLFTVTPWAVLFPSPCGSRVDGGTGLPGRAAVSEGGRRTPGERVWKSSGNRGELARERLCASLNPKDPSVKEEKRRRASETGGPEDDLAFI